MDASRLFDELAEVLSYPREGYWKAVGRCRAAWEPVAPAAAQALARFLQGVTSRSLEELQELYVQTFELNPACALEIGWHWFGENYERGEFLVKVRQELRRAGVAESSELPDHLCHILRLLGRLPGPEASAFANRFVVPVLEKIQAALEAASSPFRHLFGAVSAALAAALQEPLREAVHG